MPVYFMGSEPALTIAANAVIKWELTLYIMHTNILVHPQRTKREIEASGDEGTPAQRSRAKVDRSVIVTLC